MVINRINGIFFLMGISPKRIVCDLLKILRINNLMVKADHHIVVVVALRKGINIACHNFKFCNTKSDSIYSQDILNIK